MKQVNTLLIVTTIILACWLILVMLDSETTETQTIRSAETLVSPDGGEKLASVSSLIGGLEARLAESPEDGKGWLLLAKSYHHLGETRQASTAYRRAAELGLSDPTFEQTLVRETLAGDGWQ